MTEYYKLPVAEKQVILFHIAIFMYSANLFGGACATANYLCTQPQKRIHV